MSDVPLQAGFCSGRCLWFLMGEVPRSLVSGRCLWFLMSEVLLSLVSYEAGAGFPIAVARTTTLARKLVLATVPPLASLDAAISRNRRSCPE